MMNDFDSIFHQNADQQCSSSTQDSILNDQQGRIVEENSQQLSNNNSFSYLQQDMNYLEAKPYNFQNYMMPFDDQTLRKKNRKSNQIITQQQQRVLNQSQHELIQRLKKQNIKYTQEFLEIIVAKLEEKDYYLESYVTYGGESDIYQGYHKSCSEGVISERVFKIIKCESIDFHDKMNEYNLVKTIQYPMNIIQFYDAIYLQEQYICIFIIELCECSLEDELRTIVQNRLLFSKLQLLQIIFDLLDGLIELRANNIIHQDIKPGNILKTKTGKYVYSDFGISGKLKNNSVEVKGFTLYFCPPEQITQESLSNYKGDIYSLGKTFQRLIQFYRNSKEDYYDSPFLKDLQQIIENNMINQKQNERMDCLDLIQAICDIVLSNNLKEFSKQYLEKVNLINSLSKYDNTKDIPFVLKAKKIYHTLHLQITLYLNNIQLCRDQIISSQINLHIQSLQKNQQEMKNIPDSIQSLAICYFDLGEIENALKFQLESLKLYKQIYSENHSNVSSSYNNIAELYASLGQTQIALNYQIKSLEINLAIYKTNHPSISISLNNLGKRYIELGDFQKALLYQKQSLKMRRILYKGSHQQIANSLNNIGALYSKLGDTKEALKFQEEALNMYKHLFDGNHPDTAACLNNVGKRYDEMGDTQRAILFFSESLEMYKQLYNPMHPIIATSLNNLGSIYAKINQPQKALFLQLESLEIHQQIQQENNPTVAQLYHNVGQRYAELGQFSQGLRYQLKSLEMRRQCFKANHLNIAQSLDSVGERYAEIKDYQKALAYQKEGLDMRKALLKGNHLCIASSLENVGERYAQLNEKQTALTYQLQSLKIYKKIYHGDHSYIATSLNNIGKRYDEINDSENALKYQLMSLEMRKRIYKTNHPSIAQSLNNVGERYSKLGNIQKGLEYQLESLEMYQIIYNGCHPYIATLLKNISNKYVLLGQNDKATMYQELFIEMKNPINKPLAFVKSQSSDSKQKFSQHNLMDLYKSW